MHTSFLILIAFFVVLNSVECMMNSCLQTFGSNKYDLNGLSKFTLSGSDDEYDYALTPCAIVGREACHNHAVPYEMSCQYYRRYERWFTMAFIDGKSPFLPNKNATYEENSDGPGTSVLMTTSNGNTCLGVPRYVTIKFICDKTVVRPTDMTVLRNLTSCEYHIRVRAAQACPIQ
jgi:hypothetical protein